MKRPLPVLSALLALSGCAGTYTEPTLPSDHPANAAAAETAPVTMSRTLHLATSDLVTPTSIDAEIRGRTDTAMPESAMPGMEGGIHKKDAPSPSAAPRPERDAAVAVVYVCPMHPEVTSDKPDQRCPKCGIKLVKQNGGKQP